MNPTFSIIVPVYRCAACLEPLCNRLKTSLTPLAGNSFEILLIDDRSEDNSWSVIKCLASQDPHVKGLRLSRNFGQHYAITAGLDHARGQWNVIMDCDLQDRPEEIAKLYGKALEGYDIVYAISNSRGPGGFLLGWLRRAYFWLYDLLSNSSYQTSNLSFCILSAAVRENLVRFKEFSRHISSLVRYVGFKIAGVEIEHDPRTHGESSYTWTKRFQLAYDGIIAYSSKLLKISFVAGLFFSVMAFLFGGFLIFDRLVGRVRLPGWTSLMVLISISTGMILTSIGIVGMYLEKVFLEVKNRPLYIIEETCGIKIS